MKLILGTANLNYKYGINKKEISFNEMNKILQFKNNNLKYIDTSVMYKNDKILSRFNLSNYNIISKIPSFEKKKSNSIKNEIIKCVSSSAKKLRIKNFYAILLHRPNDLLGKKCSKIYEGLLEIKKLKLTKKIGISGYYQEDLDLFNDYKLDIVQFPFNIFDQRLLKKKNIELVKKKKIELHARSIFLQGVLINKVINSKNKFFSKKMNKKISNLQLFSKKNNLNPIDLSINFTKSQKIFKHCVVGVDNFKHYKELCSYFKKKYTKKINYDNFSITDNKIILPSLWPKK